MQAKGARSGVGTAEDRRAFRQAARGFPGAPPGSSLPDGAQGLGVRVRDALLASPAWPCGILLVNFPVFCPGEKKKS